MFLICIAYIYVGLKGKQYVRNNLLTTLKQFRFIINVNNYSTNK